MRAKFVNENINNIFKPKSREDIIRDLSALSKDELGEQLIKASKQGLTNIVQWIIDAGVDVNAKDNVGRTALMWASWNGHDSCVKVLLDNGADVKAKDTYGLTALMFASGYGNNSCVKLLLDNGADVNAKDNDGQTALMFASRFGQKDVVELLKIWRKKMRAKFVNEDVKDFLKPRSKDEISAAFNLLTSKQHQFNVAIKHGIIDKVKELLSDPQVNPCYNTCNALYYAIEQKNYRLTELLLQDERVRNYAKDYLRDLLYFLVSSENIEDLNIKKLLIKYNV